MTTLDEALEQALDAYEHVGGDELCRGRHGGKESGIAGLATKFYE